MTQDEIIRMAQEAGSLVFQSNFYDNSFDFNSEQLERFAALVAETTGIEQQREIIRLKAIIEEQANGAQNLVLAERDKALEAARTVGGEFFVEFEKVYLK